MATWSACCAALTARSETGWSFSTNRRSWIPVLDEIHSWIDGRRRAAAHGTGEMPIWGLRMGYDAGGGSDELTSARIEAIVFYLQSIQRPFYTSTGDVD